MHVALRNPERARPLLGAVGPRDAKDRLLPRPGLRRYDRRRSGQRAAIVVRRYPFSRATRRSTHSKIWRTDAR
jgi:hypothetical protein